MMEPQYKTGLNWWPGLKILDRYIIRKFVGTYLFSIAMIVIVVVVFDYVEKIDDFATNHAPIDAIVDYYLNFVPFFVNQFSALFTFVACIFFTSKLAHRTEIVAMLSGGMSFRRLMWPYFIGALVITAISLSLSLWIIPVSQRTCVSFEETYITRNKNRSVRYDRHIYRQIEPGTFLYIRGFSNNSKQASFMAIEKYEGGSVRESLDASEVKFDEAAKRWTAQRYIKRSFDENGVETFSQHRNLDTLLNIDINELGNMQSMVKTMKIGELNAFIDQQKAKGSDMIRHFEVEHHTRYSYPLGTFILTLIGVSLSSRKLRGGTGLHIGIGIVLCFSYILLTRIFEVFARGGSLPSMLAVWLPNILYTIIAIYLYHKAPK